LATSTYKCPNCGAGLLFDPELQKVRCDFCLSEFSIAEIEAYNQKLETEAEQPAKLPRETDENSHLISYHCDSCGAEVVTDETTSATFCYYCHNPVLVTERLTGSYRPQNSSRSRLTGKGRWTSSKPMPAARNSSPRISPAPPSWKK